MGCHGQHPVSRRQTEFASFELLDSSPDGCTEAILLGMGSGRPEE